MPQQEQLGSLWPRNAQANLRVCWGLDLFRKLFEVEIVAFALYSPDRINLGAAMSSTYHIDVPLPGELLKK